jgi:hypothetical protein
MISSYSGGEWGKKKMPPPVELASFDFNIADIHE